MKHGTPIVCVSNPAGGCTKPYHDTADVNGGGPHGYANAKNDVNRGKMNGFVAQATNGPKGCLKSRGPGVHKRRCTRCDGIPHRCRDP